MHYNDCIITRAETHGYTQEDIPPSPREYTPCETTGVLIWVMTFKLVCFSLEALNGARWMILRFLRGNKWRWTKPKKRNVPVAESFQRNFYDLSFRARNVPRPRKNMKGNIYRGGGWWSFVLKTRANALSPCSR